MKKTIAIDLDDVLATSARGFITYSNQKWGTSLAIDDYDEDWAKMWGVEHGEAVMRAEHFHANGIVKHHMHFEEAVRVLKALKDRYRLVVATSRRMSIQTDTLEWLDMYFKGIFSDVRFAGMWDKPNKHAIKVTKAALCKEVGADFLIDDQPKHCFAVAEAGMQAILFGDYSWNQVNKLPARVTRAHDWLEVEAYFNGND